MHIDRRALMTGAATSLVTGFIARAGELEKFPPTAPADAGFSPDLEARLDKLIAGKRVWGLHGVVVLRNRRTVLERYFAGEDEIWGKSLGLVQHAADQPHDMRSVSKSIVGLLYGIALSAGKVPPVDTPLAAAFPEYADVFAADERRRKLTVFHALTMTLGMEWNENVPYDSPANNEIAMEMAKDRYRYVLDRPIVGPPGKRFVYGGGDTALLGRLIMKGTGHGLHDYARAALFDPLGLGPTAWIKGEEIWFGGGDGEPAAASGLRMTPRDLAAIGQLVLDNGAAGGRQIVPAQWLADCLTPRVSVDEWRRYGYQWYIGDFQYGPHEEPRLDRWFGCFGLGGQRLWVMPELALVVAITAGNYSKPDQWRPPIRVMREVVLASVQ